MKLLVIGSGGREHALCWRLARSAGVEQLYCAPGNPGTAECATNVALGADDLEGLVDFARSEAVDLVVVGPEAPLCAGIADRLTAVGVGVVGPSQAAAQLEGSKIFAKQLMHRHGVPTARFGVFDELDAAARYIAAHPNARVIKADGLAAGKGVFVCKEEGEAIEAVERLLGGALGRAGSRVLVEDRLDGEEVSVIALADGERVMMLASSQDHKAVYDGDRGPNTGGMGAYSPAPVLSPELADEVEQRVLLPVVRALAEAKTPYRGVLYAGLMIVDGEPQVLEFNCRMGDPETQPLMMRFADDLPAYLSGVASGRLPEREPRWDPRPALCVVLTSEGYPGAYAKGRPIEGIEHAREMADVALFHAGTARAGDQLVTAGGRVLGVTALGDDLGAARDLAYRAADRIHWEGQHARRDIGHRALR